MSGSERVALFSGGGSRTTNASKALVEFRAGKMTMSGNLVTPDKRKGMVMVEQGDDQLMHFKWKDRTSGNIEDDLIIFPDDVEFKKVTQCTTGRAFILKFKSTTRKLFFWMQEPKDDKDEEFCKKVNDYLNNPPAPGSSGSRGGSMGGSGGSGGIPGLDLSNLGDSELQSLLNNMNQSQLMQLLGGGGGGLSALTGGSSSSRQQQRLSTATTSSGSTTSTTTASSTTATPTTTTATPTTGSGSRSKPTESASNIRLSDLQNVLSGLPGAGAGASSGPNVDLSSGLSSEVLQPLLENPDFVKKMKELLPEEEKRTEDGQGQVRGTLHSPQFKQALGMFSSGLQTGQLAPLIREFNLGDAAIEAATKGDMEAFVKALQEKNKKGSSEGEAAKKKEEDDGMALD